MSNTSPSLSSHSCSEGSQDDDSKFNDMDSPRANIFAQTSKASDNEHRVRLEQLKSYPLFGDLQVTLALECLQSTLPFSLLSDACSPLTSPGKPESAFCTVSDKIMEEHSKLQIALLSVGVYHPELFRYYMNYTDKLEGERYKALSCNSHNDSIKQTINWFYDNERKNHMAKVQNMVNACTTLMNTGITGTTGPTMLPDPSKLNFNASLLNSLMASLGFPLPTTVVPPLSTPAPPDKEFESPLDLSGPPAHPKLRTQSISIEKKSRFLSKNAVGILQDWYRRHKDHPYANDEEVKELAAAGGIAPNQVKKWMANTRARSYNTLTYNGGKQMLNSKLAIKKRLLHKYRIEPPKTLPGSNYSEIMPIHSKATTPLSFVKPVLQSPSDQPSYPEEQELNQSHPEELKRSTSEEDDVKDEPIDVETISPKSPDAHQSQASTIIDSCNNMDNSPENIILKPSLEEVIARCHLKSSEIKAESAEGDSTGKSAIESLKDVVNNVSSVDSFPTASHIDMEAQPEPHGATISSKRYLSSRAKAVLSEWFRAHLYRPYPTFEEKKELAKLCGISSSKVDTWFANKRNRTHNTKKLPPKYSHLLHYASRKPTTSDS